MVEPTQGGVVIRVRVIPRAGRAGVAGSRGDALLVRLNASPVEGAANAELRELIATALHVSKRSVSIAAGERSRQKRIRIEGIDVATAKSRLEML